MQTLVDTSSEDISDPKTKLTVLVGNDMELYKHLAIAKALSYEKSLSFVFQTDLWSLFARTVQKSAISSC